MRSTNIIILSLFLTIIDLTSCSADSQIQENASLNDQNLDRPLGNVVSEMDTCVFIIYQDQNKNYWFGSDGQGVYKYGGDSLTHYTAEDGLSNNRIREIKEDKDGNIFINTLEGVSKFDGHTFTTLEIVENEPGLNEWKLEPDDLWFKSKPGDNGPYRFDGKVLYHLEFPKHYLEDEFYARHPVVPYNPYEVYSIYTDTNGDVWFGTSNFGLCRFNGESLSWMYEKHLTEIGDASFGIRSIVEDREGLFWICNTNYRYKIQEHDSVSGNTNYIKYEKSEGVGFLEENSRMEFPYFMSAITDSIGDLWMATYNDGVYHYNGEYLEHFPLNENGKIITLYSIYKDRDNTLWLGSHNSGALKFNGVLFEKFKPE